MKFLARGSFLLVTALWGSFYAIAKAALTHVDPIIFTLFEAITLVPLALTLLILQRHTLNQAVLKRGFLLGSCLCIATLTITVSEKFTGATNTAFFPSTGGTFAAIITAIVFGRSLAKSIWAACLLSLLGVFLLLHASLSGEELRGDGIALVGALLFTVYLFLVDQDAQQEEQQFWAIVGIEHLSFALWMILFSLLFGDWQHFHPVLSHDIPVILYVSLVCTFLPVLLTHFAHRHIDPLETGFISILEPLWGALIAHVYLGERVSLPLLLGGGLILSGTLVHLIGGNLLQCSQWIAHLMQKETTRTRTTQKHWVKLPSIPSPLLFLRRMLIWMDQNVSLACQYHVRGLSDFWKAQHITRSIALLLQVWFPLLTTRTPWDTSRGRGLFLQKKSVVPLFPPSQSAAWCAWMKAQTTRPSSLIPSFSCWRVLSSNSSNLPIVLADTPEMRWHQQSQHSVPP